MEAETGAGEAEVEGMERVKEAGLEAEVGREDVGG